MSSNGGAVYHKALSMIERYTIKFGPAVSQKELERALHADDLTALEKALHFKVRIELVGEAEDIKKLSELLKLLSHQPEESLRAM